MNAKQQTEVSVEYTTSTEMRKRLSKIVGTVYDIAEVEDKWVSAHIVEEIGKNSDDLYIPDYAEKQKRIKNRLDFEEKYPKNTPRQTDLRIKLREMMRVREALMIKEESENRVKVLN